MIIKVNNLTKKYGNNLVLNKLSIEIPKGSMVSIQGKSGSGKSTLLNILGTIENIDGGVVTVLDNENVKPNTKKSRDLLRNSIAFLFQNYALIDNLSVEKNLKIALKYNSIYSQNDIPKMLEKVGLSGFEQKKVFELSGGEQQRVALARVMLKPCEIILADEPTGNVDEYNKMKIMNIFKELHKEGKTIVIVTHDLTLDKYFDKVYTI